MALTHATHESRRRSWHRGRKSSYRWQKPRDVSTGTRRLRTISKTSSI